jgi:haloalkane dehalogenase
MLYPVVSSLSHMTVLRTSEDRFSDLPDFPYEPNYVSTENGRIAYVERGDGPETFLCLHGVPTWSFLYRKMMPILAERGRVIVPDFLGHGRSDKYPSMDDYDFSLHEEALTEFIETLDLKGVTLVGQDWGGAHGLHVATTKLPERFDRLVPMNTVGNTLPDEEGNFTSSREFEAWHEFVRTMPNLPIAEIIEQGLIVGDIQFDSSYEHATIDLTEEEKRGYEAPFPSPRYKAGARKWPLMVPTSPEMDGAEQMLATRDALAEWEKPAFVLFSDSDPITHNARDLLRRIIPGAKNQPDIWIEGVGHFLQETAGETVATHIVDFVDRTPTE